MIIVGEAQMVAGAKLDFTIDWSERLGGDTLAFRAGGDAGQPVAGLLLVGPSEDGA